jgi:hypothetical protein
MGEAERNTEDTAALIVRGWQIDHGQPLQDWEQSIIKAAATAVVEELEHAGTPVLHIEHGKISGRTWTCVLHKEGVDLLRFVIPPDEETVYVRRRFVGRPAGLGYHEEIGSDDATIVVVTATGLDEPIRVRVRSRVRDDAIAAMNVVRGWARSGPAPDHAT